MADSTTQILGAINLAQNAVINDVNSQSTFTDNLIAAAKVSVNQSVGNAEIQILNSITNSEKTIFNQATLNSAGIVSRLNFLKNDVYNKVDQATQNIATGLSAVKVYVKDLAAAQGIDLNTSIANGFTIAKNLQEKETEDLKNAFKDSGDKTAAAIGVLYDKIPGIVSDSQTVQQDFLTVLIQQTTGSFVEWFGKNIIPLLNDAEKLKLIMDGIVSGKIKDDDAILKSIAGTTGNVGVINAVFEVILATPIIAKSLIALATPYAANIERITVRKALPNRPDTTSVTKAYLKGEINRNELIDKFKDLGIPEDEIPFFIDANLSVLDMNSLKQLYLRGEINKNALEQGMKALGIDASAFGGIEQLFNVLPGLNDLITMAVREVFSPEIARKFGQFDEFPDDFGHYASQQGLSKEWAQRYWAMHWQLPGAQAGYEMLHREVINDNDLDALLKANDVMPFWRNKLKAIAYNVVPRLAIRQLYSTGVYNEQDVLKGFKKAGYNDEDAKDLADYVIRHEAASGDMGEQEIRSLQKSVYITGYKRGAISKSKFRQAFRDIKYQDDDIDKILDILDYQRHTEMIPDKSPDYIQKLVNHLVSAYRTRSISKEEFRRAMGNIGFSTDEIDHEIDFTDYEEKLDFKNYILSEIKSAYLARIINDGELTSILASYGFTDNEIQQLLREYATIRYLHVKRPSEAQIAKMYKKGFISVDDYAEELRGFGYAEKYIENIIKIT